MATDFGLLPPEVNSGRMYAGPGAGSMLSAANAWDGLAAVLNSSAISYRSVISGLSIDLWLGPASATMAAAAAPYAGWLGAASVQAEQTAAGARRAASAYETAFSMTVPPPLIEANRNQVTSLATTNTLGLNTPVIEALQAEYAEMWAQDAAAMFGYAAASQAASTLSPFNTPIPTSDPAGPAAAGAASASATATGVQFTSPVSGTVPATAAALPTPIGDLDIAAAYIAVLSTASLSLSVVNTFRPWIFAYKHSDGDDLPDAGPVQPTQGTTIRSASTPAGGRPVSADVGRAALVGALTVPHSWTTAAPEIRLAVQALPSPGLSAAPTTLGAMPAALLGGMALAGMAGRGGSSPGSQAPAQPGHDDEGQPERKPTVVVIQQPPPLPGPRS